MGKKPIIVTIHKTRHHNQPWVSIIDDPSPGPELRISERYTRKYSAKRGAIRKLKAQQSPVTREWFVNIGKTGNIRWIEFVTKPSKR